MVACVGVIWVDGGREYLISVGAWCAQEGAACVACGRYGMKNLLRYIRDK